MSERFSISMGMMAVALVGALLMPGGAAGQDKSATQSTPPTAAPAAKPTGTAKNSTLPRTPDGQPDLQGVWDYRTITPLERPKDLGTKAFFYRGRSRGIRKERKSAPESRSDRS